MHEWIGIAGSLMIIFAFTKKDEKMIRLLDTVGAGLFVIYGLITKTWATVFLNAVLICVHIKRFIEMRKPPV